MKQWTSLRVLRDAEWKLFSFYPYRYEVEASDRIILGAIMGGLDVAIAISRQAGKTTAVVMTIAFLMRYMPELTGKFWSVGFFTPQKEQFKTDRDRLLSHLKRGEQLYKYNVLEANANTLRIGYGKGEADMMAECFLFPVSPTSHPESKTLHMAIVEESHKLNERIFNEDIRPMLASTNGSIIRTGVAGTQKKQFMQLLKRPIAFQANDVRVMAEKKKAFDETGDTYHMNYAAFLEKEKRELGGEDSIPYKLNYRLEWCIGKGHFVTEDKLEAARSKEAPPPITDVYEWVAVGVDHARNFDRTWAIAVAKKIEWQKPRIIHIERLEKMKYSAQAKRVVDLLRSFKGATDVICIPDSTGQGDFMGDEIENKSDHEWSSDHEPSNLIRFKFTQQGKDETAEMLLQVFRDGTVELPPVGTFVDQQEFENELLELELHMKGNLRTWYAPESASETVDGREPHDDAAASFMLALVGMRQMNARITPSIRLV